MSPPEGPSGPLPRRSGDGTAGDKGAVRFEEGGGVLERGPPRRAPAPWRTGAGLAAGRATGGAESDRAPAGRAAVNLWGALEVMAMGAGVLRRDAASFEV